MTKVLMTGVVVETSKTIYDRQDGTQGFVGCINIKLQKARYEVADVKVFTKEVWVKAVKGDLVYVEGSISCQNYKGRWYSDVIVYNITVLQEKFETVEKKEETTPEKKDEPTPVEKTEDPKPDETCEGTSEYIADDDYKV